MTRPPDGLDALAAQIDDLRREVEGLRHTVDADIDALGALLDESVGDGGTPVGAIPALTTGLDDARVHLAALAEQISGLVEREGATPRLPSWTELGAEEARAAWARLARWMSSVLFPRYPATTEIIRDCWYRHPELVEQMSWLHIAWALAYQNPKSSISTAAEWHNRWLPAVLARTREILKPCYIQHVDDSRVPPERHRGFDNAFEAFVRADAIRRRRTDQGDP